MLGRASRRLAQRNGVPVASDVRRLLRQGTPDVVFQPILDLASGHVTGYEALSRFGHPPFAEPQVWFYAAHRCGLGADLEARAITGALRLGDQRPPGTLLSVNVSPSVLDSVVLDTVLPRDLTGLQFEITEHELADDAGALLAALDRLRRRGARIAVDDVGQGYAGLKRVMGIRPDVLKLDREIVAGVSREPAKVAMLEAVVHFAARTGSEVCAEGLETVDDLAAVTDLDVSLAQGWVVGHPQADFAPASAEARAVCAAARAGGLRGWDGSSRDIAQLLPALAEAADLGEVAGRITDAAPLLGCDVVRLAVLDGERLVGPRVSASASTAAVAAAAVPYVLADFPTARLVLAERTISQVFAGTVREDAAEKRLLEATGCRSMLLLPLVSGGRAVGLLECFHTEERPWGRGQLRVARMVAAALGPVVGSLAPR